MVWSVLVVFFVGMLAGSLVLASLKTPWSRAPLE